MQVFSNNRIVSHFPKAPPPSAHAKPRARGLRTIFFKSPDFLRRGKPEFPLRKQPPSFRLLSARQSQRPKKNGGAFRENPFRPARENPNAPPKEKFAPPEPSANFKPRAKTAANGLRGSLPAILPTAPGYAFGLFPKRRRLSWRTGGWRNILRRARRAPRKRGRPFAG